MTKVIAFIAYIVGTSMMLFGWLCTLVQGDAPQGEPRIAGLVILFTIALGLLALPAIRLYREKRGFPSVLLFFIGVQAVACLYAIVAEFTL